MLRKQTGFTLKVIWIIIALLTPTITLFVRHDLRYDAKSSTMYNGFLYITAILLIVVGACIALFIWKKPYGLFALSFGFLITLLSYPIASWFLGGTYWRDVDDGFGGVSLSIIVISIMYSIPFAVISFLPSIPTIVRWSRRRKFRQPGISNKSVD